MRLTQHLMHDVKGVYPLDHDGSSMGYFNIPIYLEPILKVGRRLDVY
jgi:hypothetical protein